MSVSDRDARPSEARLATAFGHAGLGGLMLLSIMLPLERIQPLVNLPGIVFTNTEVALFLAAGLWGAGLLAARRAPLISRRLALPAIAWVMVLLASAALAPAPQLGPFKFTGRMVLGLLAGWVAHDTAWRYTRLPLLARGLATSGLVVAVLGLAEISQVPFVVPLLMSFKRAPTFFGDVVRLSSTLTYATIASMVLELTAPLCLAWAVTTRERPARAALALALLSILAAQVLTLTRGGLIALLTALGWMTFEAIRQREKRLAVGAVSAAGALIVLAGLVFARNPVLTLRLSAESDRLWYQASYKAPSELTMEAGQVATVTLGVTNAGLCAWRVDEPHPFYLGYHLMRPDGSVARFEGDRSTLPGNAAAGATQQVTAQVTAPTVPGEYVIEWDMLQEEVTWFKWKGSPTAVTQLTVVPSSQPTTLTPEDTVPPARLPAVIEQPGRLQLWRVAVAMVADRPLFGVGPDNYRWLYGRYAAMEAWNQEIHSNNLYLEWAAGTGIVGILAFLWLTWRIVQGTYRQVRSSPASPERIWRLALMASLITWFVHGMVDSFYEFTPTYLALWLVAGLATTPAGAGKEWSCALDSK